MAGALIEKARREIRGLDPKAMEQAQRRWDSVAKPLKSLGLLEEAVIKIAGITGCAESSQIGKKAVTVLCGDNGIVEEGVTQTGQAVTAVVAENLTRGDSCVCIMARQAGAWVFPVDMGIRRRISSYGEFVSGSDKLAPLGGEGRSQADGGAGTREQGAGACRAKARDGKGAAILYPALDRRLMPGTRNFTKAPAMDRETAIKAVETGICLAGELKKRGYQILAAGEMGIGNTTTTSAVLSVLLGSAPRQVTGRGAGLSTEGLQRKIQVIEEGIRLWQPDPEDGIDVLAKVGGLDLAGLAGVFLGGALYRLPVIVDGLIASAAALAAVAICPAAKACMLASHVSAEPAGKQVLDTLGLRPVIYGDLCLGEGTGAVALFPLLDMAAAVYDEMSTFSQIHIEAYKPLT